MAAWQQAPPTPQVIEKSVENQVTQIVEKIVTHIVQAAAKQGTVLVVGKID